jgi:hypothetical protein
METELNLYYDGPVYCHWRNELVEGGAPEEMPAMRVDFYGKCPHCGLAVDIPPGQPTMFEQLLCPKCADAADLNGICPCCWGAMEPSGSECKQNIPSPQTAKRQEKM